MSLELRQSEEDNKKQKFRVTNWAEYDRALVRRGDINVWFAEDFLNTGWLSPATGKRGKPTVYSAGAIKALLVVKAVFSLTYRSLEGFARSLLKLMNLDLPVPDHSHISRRASDLEVTITRRPATEPRHIVVDSTGVKIYGEGEWKVRQHGVSKRRTWRRVHFAVDADSKDVVGVEVTTVDWVDCEVLSGLLEQIKEPIGQVDGDGAYDTREVHDAIAARGAKAAIPPRENAVAWEENHPRTLIVAAVAELGMAGWKKESGYHRRSLAENAMYRFKQLFSDRLASRQFETQVTEVHARVAAMNMMTSLGMPISIRVGTTTF
jgi:hypothetical protein